MRTISFTILMILLLQAVINPAASTGSSVEISSIFSDENSMDVTLQSTDRVENGKIVFRLSHDNEILETRTVNLDMEPDSTTTKVVGWDSHFKFGIYTASVRVYIKDELVAEDSDSFSYGFEVLPRFQILDISASSSGVNLLTAPRSVSPAVADFDFQLIHDGDIIYSEEYDNIPIIQATQTSINWPVLLEDHTEYTVRIKAFSHTPNIITSYITEFSSRQDVEIDEADVDVDDFGVSVTIYGRSQVPFDGIMEVALQQNGGEKLIFSEKPEILTLNRDDTVGIIWNDLEPGTYHVNILVKTLDNEILDQYETMLVIPERANLATEPAKTQTPGFGAIVSIVIVVILAMNIRKM